MTRLKRSPYPRLEIHLLREGLLESIHQGEVVVADDRSRILAVAGDTETVSFMRSAMKPFQALAVTSTGVMERFDLNDKDLAIICSSHQGNIEQARQVFNILWRADIESSYLKCPIPEGKDSALQYNCSGKHAGMLAVCQQRNWNLDTYFHRSNPVQQLILQKIAELLAIPGAEIMTARDDCGVPTYALELGQMATLYAKLANGNNIDLERILRAMTNHPTMVAGEGAFDTELMTLTDGMLVSKSGAEGIQCIGNIGQNMGLAIKILDGAKRAKYATAIHVLKQLGWITPTVAQNLGDKFLRIDDYKRLEVAGELSFL
ncbi:MAG: asparaginase [Cyanobacteria bacterium]|nr:asparaginase [Cyanobacteria bacterium CG_2015-16_32_12]NCO79211.1 asparaginase [Cyanobacteria bacterium CG_2015-22_32_23]NCQ03434.1 asparaginase [Cyanobacteria bacterium CG_2015-09_32_10]NCQ41000.1 asparaginase [Cyanobacteria bacterium CG_2015-04_32_10]NCS85309.1 asparaginase [Cyanobacteria bacterium CG_2015-02_32_10]